MAQQLGQQVLGQDNQQNAERHAGQEQWQESMCIYNPWRFIHSEEFTTDIVIDEVQEVYSTGPPVDEDGEFMEVEQEAVQLFTYTKDDPDEDDLHEEKFMLRFLATNTTDRHRYLWVTDSGEVRTDGGYSNLATFFEVIHWCSTGQNCYQLICYGGNCKGYILYMDGTSLKTRIYHEKGDDSDITTKFQMLPKGDDNSVLAFISKTGIPIYFDDDGNFRPEGPTTPRGQRPTDSGLQPLFFIAANVKLVKVSSV